MISSVGILIIECAHHSALPCSLLPLANHFRIAYSFFVEWDAYNLTFALYLHGMRYIRENTVPHQVFDGIYAMYRHKWPCVTYYLQI